MSQIQEYLNKIICGSALEVLRKIKTGTVSCSISSPPYWGLRDYGLKPSVWDGDKDCKHKWDGEIIQRQRGAASGRTAKTGTHKKGIQGTHTHNGQFCSKCGAWLGCLGLEPTFELYIKHLCDIYDEVKRVLRNDATCFVNLGDTYNGSGGDHKAHHKNDASFQSGIMRGSQPTNSARIPTKSLCLIPQRFAIEMVNRGWILRNVIIWAKNNPMPSSASDRFTVDFEYVFFFVKSNKPSYYVHPRKMRTSSTKKYDYIWTHKNTGLEVDYQPFSDRLCKGKKRLWNRRNLWEGRDYWFEPQYEPYNYDGRHKTTLDPTRKYGSRNYTLDNPQQMARQPMERWPCSLGRNKRTTWKLTKEDWLKWCEQVWEFTEESGALWQIPTQSFPEAHFATYPEKLVEPMIKAGCPEFICSKCGKAREKIYDTKYINQSMTKTEKYSQQAKKFGTNPTYGRGETNHYFKGYTDCGCQNREWRPGVVLDCFRGNGDNRIGSCKTAA